MQLHNREMAVGENGGGGFVGKGRGDSKRCRAREQAKEAQDLGAVWKSAMSDLDVNGRRREWW